jgi:GT2 family glycosyltransferase
MKTPLITIVIVTFNNADTIEACLRSIGERTGAPYEIRLVDNSPDEKTLTALELVARSLPDLPLEILRPATNVGFARACNLGAREGKGDFLLFLNPDTVFLDDVPARLMAFAEGHPRAAVVGPLIVDAAGTITRTCRNLPSLFRIGLDATGLDRWLGAYRLLHFSHTTPRQVGQVIGACFFTPRWAFRALAGFDERFFVYFEEVDYCKRALDRGWEVWFAPAARVRHDHGTSTENVSQAAQMIFTLRDSRQKYFRKHFGGLSRILLLALNRAEGLVKGFIFLVLWLVRKGATDLEKARGFWRVARW